MLVVASLACVPTVAMLVVASLACVPTVAMLVVDSIITGDVCRTDKSVKF